MQQPVDGYAACCCRWGGGSGCGRGWRRCAAPRRRRCWRRLCRLFGLHLVGRKASAHPLSPSFAMGCKISGDHTVNPSAAGSPACQHFGFDRQQNATPGCPMRRWGLDETQLMIVKFKIRPPGRTLGFGRQGVKFFALLGHSAVQEQSGQALVGACM